MSHSNTSPCSPTVDRAFAIDSPLLHRPLHASANRKPRHRVLLHFILSLLATAATTAHAAVYLSGDGNIVNHLLASGGIDPGNQLFFKNILEGGTKVAVLRNTFPGCCETFDENISAYYNSLPGVTATTIIGTVDAAGLSGANLFLSAIPDDAFAAPEITALHNFIVGGGSVFFLGENSNFPAQNSFINNALVGLGIPMSITADTNESGDKTVTGANIASAPSTAGVTTFTYSAPSYAS